MSFERIVLCGIKEKGGKQERVENKEAKNLPNGRTLTNHCRLRHHQCYEQHKSSEVLMRKALILSTSDVDQSPEEALK